MDKHWETVERVDMDELEKQLVVLLDSYRSAFKFVERLPLIGVYGIVEKDLAQTTAKSRSIMRLVRGPFAAEGRLVVRPLVRLFVESHVRSKFETLIRYLQLEGMAISDDSEELAKKLDFYVKRLDQGKQILFGWSTLRLIIPNTPFLPTVIALVFAILTQLTGIDLSSPNSLGKSVAETVQSTGLTPILTTLKLFGELLLLTYMFLVPLAMRYGFRVKRAIFMGGEAESGIFDESVKKEKWVNFPRANIYQQENRVFEILHMPKPSEFPLDFVLTITPYYVFVFAVLDSVYWAGAIINGIAPPLWDIVGLSSLWLMTGFNLRYGLRNYRRRRELGNI